MGSVTTVGGRPDGALGDRHDILVSVLSALGYDHTVASLGEVDAVDEHAIVVETDDGRVIGQPDGAYSDVVLDVVFPETVDEAWGGASENLRESDGLPGAVVALRQKITDEWEKASNTVRYDSILLTSHGTLDRDEDNLRGMEANLFDAAVNNSLVDRQLVVMTGWGADDMGEKIRTELSPTAVVTEGGTQLFEIDTDDDGLREPQSLYDVQQRREAITAWRRLLTKIRSRFDDPVLFTQGNRVGVCVYVNPTPGVLTELGEPASTPFAGDAPARGLAEAVADGLPVAEPGEIDADIDAVDVRARDDERLRFERPSGVDEDTFPYLIEKTLARHWTLLPYRVADASRSHLDVELLGVGDLDALTDRSLDRAEAERILDGLTDGGYDPVAVGQDTELHALVDGMPDADNVEPQTDCCVDVFVESKGEAFQEGALLDRLGCNQERTNIDYVSKGTSSDRALIEAMNEYANDTKCSFTCKAPADSPPVFEEELNDIVDIVEDTDPTAILADMYKTRSLYRRFQGRLS